MAHLFIDDGTIDSEEYASNYIHFDGSDVESVSERIPRLRRTKQQDFFELKARGLPSLL